MDSFIRRLLDEVEQLYFSGIGCLEAIELVKVKYKVFLDLEE